MSILFLEQFLQRLCFPEHNHYFHIVSLISTPGLNENESFHFQTPKGQTTGFIFPRVGNVELFGESLAPNHLSILENNEGDLSINALTDSQFIIAMASPQNHPIIAEQGSIHTNRISMERSFERIKKARATVIKN